MSLNEVKVSIVVPIYNAAQTLEQCLDSLRAQTFKSFEVVIVDDGSTDDSSLIARRYCEIDERFTLVIQEENGGPGRARNRALDLACGEYVLCVDGDDWIEPTLLEKAVVKADDTGADIVVWNTWLHDENTGECCPSDMVHVDVCEPGRYDWRNNPDPLFVSFQNWPWNKLIRRSLLEEHSIRFQDILRTEDLMYTAPALVKANFIVGVPEELSHYRIGQRASAMATKDTAPLDFFTAFESLRTWLIDEGVYEQLEASYARWALPSVIYNIKTLKTWDAFQSTCHFMAKEGLERLGLFKAKKYLDEWNSNELERLHTLQPSSYLIAALNHEWSLRDGLSVRTCADRLALKEAHERIRITEAEVESAARERVEHERVQQRLDEVLASNAYKIGKAICVVPHAIKQMFVTMGMHLRPHRYTCPSNQSKQ